MACWILYGLLDTIWYIVYYMVYHRYLLIRPHRFSNCQQCLPSSFPMTEDFCFSDPCQNGATCELLMEEDEEGYLCHCAEGFLGTFCEISKFFKKDKERPKIESKIKLQIPEY